MAAPAPTRGWPRAAVLVAAAALYFALQVGSYTQKSATYDEPVHLAAGYAALVYGDHRLDACHPPFVRMWAALPLLAMSGFRFDSARIDPLTQEQTIVEQNVIAHDFVYGGTHIDRTLGSARFMITSATACSTIPTSPYTAESTRPCANPSELVRIAVTTMMASARWLAPSSNAAFGFRSTYTW